MAAALLLHGSAPAGDGRDLRVDAGGVSLHARTLGAGSPTVVFESGGGGAPLEAWGPVPGLVAARTSVVVYDRAGIGGSGPGARPRTGERIARELHALLAGLGATPPYVLVGHSLGGAYVRFFASLWPGEVAGFVFLEPTTEEMKPRLRTEEDRRRFEASLAHLSPGARAELEALAATVEALARLPAPPDRPAVVVTGTALPAVPPEQRDAMAAAGITEETLRAARDRVRGSHERLAARFPRGRHVEAAKAGHDVHADDPGLVRDEVLKVVEAAARAR